MKTFAAYLDALEKGSPDEWEKFVNSLTTNLTSFFREPHHFPIFAEHLKKIANRRPIKVWCSAASTGEEPYSIAITVQEALGAAASQVQIIASDLDTNVLATADKGVYPLERGGAHGSGAPAPVFPQRHRCPGRHGFRASRTAADDRVQAG